MARLAHKTNISEDEMLQRIDLKKIYGREPTAAEKKQFAAEAIDYINDRTLDGGDVGGKKFHKYSEAYAKKKGVSVDSVDLFLSGDMLDGVVRDKNKELKSEVAIDVKGSDEKERGFFHQTGDGQPTRQWFGLTTNQAEAIALSVQESKTTTVRKLSGGQQKKAAEPKTNNTTLQDLINEIGKLGIEQIE